MFIENTEELAQNKLLLLYLIKLSPETYTNGELTEFVLQKNYMNYFLIQQYLSELTEAQFINTTNVGNREVYSILEKGEIALSYFEERIPNKFKDELNEDFNKIEKKKKIDTQILSDCFEKENSQYVVNLKLVENEETLFSIYLDVATKKQGDLICEKWKEDTEYIYQSIIKLLTSDKTGTLE